MGAVTHVVIGLIRMVTQETCGRSRRVHLVQGVIGGEPFVLELVDGEVLVRRETEEGLLVGLPVNEVPNVWLPAVASCHIFT